MSFVRNQLKPDDGDMCEREGNVHLLQNVEVGGREGEKKMEGRRMQVGRSGVLGENADLDEREDEGKRSRYGRSDSRYKCMTGGGGEHGNRCFKREPRLLQE